MGRAFVACGAVVILAGCAGDQFKADAVIGLYASAQDAIAVSRGQFGAVPVVMVGVDDLHALEPGQSCKTAVVQVRTVGRTVGWVASKSLPRSVCERKS